MLVDGDELGLEPRLGGDVLKVLHRLAILDRCPRSLVKWTKPPPGKIALNRALELLVQAVELVGLRPAAAPEAIMSSSHTHWNVPVS